MKYNTIGASGAEGKKSTFTCYTDEEDVTNNKVIIII